MNKKTKKWLLILCILSFLVFMFFKLNERIKLVELTSINVETENQLNVDKVIVYQGYYTINRKNDAEMFENKYDKVVFEGNGTGKIKTEYGENDFFL